MRYLFHALAAIWILGLYSCRQEELQGGPQLPDSVQSLKQKVFEVMHEWYLWNEHIPELDTSSIQDGFAMMEAMKYIPTDKWSYIASSSTYDQYYNQGEYEGYGMSMVFDSNNQLRVSLVYHGSPFSLAGISRGWIIHKINGQLVSSLVASGAFGKALENTTNTFELIDTQGNIVHKTISKATVHIQAVLYKNVYIQPQGKTGYLVFNNFIGTAYSELDEAFQYLAQEGIQELVLDLRYNGGGLVNVARYIASNILGTPGNGHHFIRYQYNPAKAAENTHVAFEPPQHALSLKRLLVITSKGTASASELIINSLRPFMEVVLIGNDTYGKPVGSFAIRHQGYAINPISFSIANDRGEGGYFQGLKADIYVPDDLSRDFGDVEEARLREALHYIAHGSVSADAARRQAIPDASILPMSGFRLEIGAY